MLWSAALKGEPIFSSSVAVNTQIIIAVGEHGITFRSSDGGRTWDQQHLGIRKLNDVSVSGMTVVAVGDRGTIFVSTNGGATWNQQASAVQTDLFAVTAARSGFVAVGSSGVVLRSVDGWQWSRSDAGTQVALRAIGTSDNSESMFIGDDRGEIFKSTDQGNTWQLIFTDGSVQIHGIYIAGKTIVAAGNRGALLRSEDGGQSWAKIDTGFSNNLYSVVFNGSHQRWWVAGDNGVLISSTDAGRTWQRTHLPINRGLSSIRNTPDGNALIAGWGGTILKTDAGGAFNLLRGEPYNVEGVIYSVHAGLIAFGQGGTILTSEDFGKHWNFSTTPKDINFYGAMENQKGLWLVGDNGSIAHSTNRIDWTFNRPLVSARLKAISSTADGIHLVAVGDSGTVLWSADGGMSWSVTAGITNQNLNGVAFNDHSVVVGGDRGFIAYSSDFGEKWNPVSVNITAAFRAVIRGKAKNQLWIFGNGGTVLKTDDGGQNWSLIVNGTSDDLNAATCLQDCKTLVAAGQDGIIAWSDDFGKSWSYGNVDIPNIRSAVAASGSDLIVFSPPLQVFHLNQPKNLSGYEGLPAIQAADTGNDGRVFWAVGHSGGIWRIGPAPKDVTAFRVPTDNDLTEVVADPDGTHFWAIDDAGELATTNDGGNRWNLTAVARNRTLGSIRRIGDTLWIVGQYRTVLRLRPGMDHWESVTTISSGGSNYWDIAGDPTQRNLWIACNKGTILHSSDGGSTWTSQDTGSATSLRRILRLNGVTNTMVAVGEGGTIVRSDDDGLHWALVPGVGSEDLLDLGISGLTGQLFAVGRSGKVIISEDRGYSFYETDVGTNSDIFSVIPVMNGQIISLFGDNGTIIQLSPADQRFRAGTPSISTSVGDSLGRMEVLLPLHDFKPSKPPVFEARVRRGRDPTGTAEIEVSTAATPPLTGSDEWKIEFDLNALKPVRGETFYVHLCLRQDSYTHCFALPKLTALPLIDYQRHLAVVMAAGTIVSIVIILSALLFIKPLWLMALYRHARIFEIVETTKIPYASTIRGALNGMLLPFFALHPRTLNAWIDAYKRNITGGGETSDTQQSISPYVSLPVELQSRGSRSLVKDPSPSTLPLLLAIKRTVEIIGPGGIGKTTLLQQIHSWLYDSDSAAMLTGRKHIMPVKIDLQTGEMEPSLIEAVSRICGYKLDATILKRLLQCGHLIVLIDGFSELPLSKKESILSYIASVGIANVLVSTRELVFGQESTRILVKPLASDTVMLLITGVLSTLSPDTGLANDRKLPFRLGERIYSVLEDSGKGAPLTPLLVTLYVNKAVQALTTTGSLNNLPSSIGESYFDFVNMLIANSRDVAPAVLMRVVKKFATLSLGNDFVPRPLSYDSVISAISSASGNVVDIRDPELAITALCTSGLLVSRQAGLSSVLAFALDPIAEFCAAYAYAEQCGKNQQLWRDLKARVEKATSHPTGFVSALRMVVETFGARGIGDIGALKDWGPLLESPEHKEVTVTMGS